MVFVMGSMLPSAHAAPHRATEARTHSLISWTRYYERRMGLPVLAVEFVDDMPGGLCAHPEWVTWVDKAGLTRRRAVVYSLDKSCAAAWPADALVRHELCHWRMQHPYLTTISSSERELEAERCSRWYAEQNKDWRGVP